jgi:hypothetical protein
METPYHISALQIQRLDANQLKLRLVALKIDRRAAAFRWRLAGARPEAKVHAREALATAVKIGVVIRRIVRRLRVLENPVSRTEYFRQQKARRRMALALEGGATLSLRLTRDENALLRRALDTQNGNGETFLKRALLVGLAFVANSGNRPGGKVRITGHDLRSLNQPNQTKP